MKRRTFIKAVAAALLAPQVGLRAIEGAPLTVWGAPLVAQWSSVDPWAGQKSAVPIRHYHYAYEVEATYAFTWVHLCTEYDGR